MLGDGENILNKKILTMAQTIVLLSFIITSTFTATRIYSRFELMEANSIRVEEKVDANKLDIEEKMKEAYKHLYDRITKTSGRNKDEIAKLKEKK